MAFCFAGGVEAATTAAELEAAIKRGDPLTVPTATLLLMAPGTRATDSGPSSVPALPIPSLLSPFMSLPVLPVCAALSGTAPMPTTR